MHKEYGETVGTCSICGINLWSACNNRPAIFPCGVQSCPYETPEEQAKLASLETMFSEHGSSLQQLIESTD